MSIVAYPIWEMRYCTKEVLVDRLKVRDDKVYVFFCCDRHHTSLYSFDGSKVKKECKLCTNGKIICYRVPFDWLVNEGDLPEEYENIRAKEYEKYKRYKEKSKR